MEINKILHVATFAGQIILESGGETYRVEETICRFCTAFGLKFSESFVTPTGIMVSVSDDELNTTTLVKRVKTRTIDLQKIHLVNDLSRSLYENDYTLSEVQERLNEIQNIKRYSFAITILSSAIGAGCFAFLFKGNVMDSMAAFFVGIAIKLFTEKASRLNIDGFFINCIGGAIAAFISLIFNSFGFGSNLDTLIIGGIMLLVPGLAITNAIRDTIAGDLVSGLTRAAEAFFVAISIAVGTGLVLTLWIVLGGAL